MGAPDQLPITATLQVTPELVGALTRESRALEEAQAYVIDSQDLAIIVNDQLQDVKRRMKVVAEWDERFAAPIRQLEATRQSFFGPAKEALIGAEKYFKGLLQGWTEKERLRSADETKKREEAARRAREQAEQDAAAARARAAAAAEEARRKAAAAAEKERHALAEGNAKAAAAAAAERARQEEAERQKLAEGERKAAEAQLTASAITTAAPPAAAKLSGFSEKKNWIAELAPETTPQQASEAIVRAICGLAKDAPLPRADLLALLPVDMKAAGKLAKALETNFNVPGLKARNQPVAASRG